MTDTPRTRTGGCECGAVRFQVTGPVRGVIQCWCGQCRRLHGTAAPHTQVRIDQLTIMEDRGLVWRRTSTFARRAHCGDCGSRLFFETLDNPAGMRSISAGTFDEPSGLTLIGHIFVDDAPAHALFDDGLPRHARSWTGEPPAFFD